ncbi:MAG: TolC family protein [Candidatus Obscuribacterales bacterium]|nr:TolC family protein [Candidatus Obscuribacterales bacterium]
MFSRIRRYPLFFFLPVLVLSFLVNAGSAGAEGSSRSEEPLLRDAILPVYSLSAAVDVAVKNFPSLRAAKAKFDRSSNEVSLARTAYLPQLDVLAQEIRTTTNNIAGTIFPQPLNVIPTQTGPANNTSSFRSVFSNDYGVNFSWLLYDWGQRHSKVMVAHSQVAQANAGMKLTALDVANAAADAYLTSVETKETIKAQLAIVERMKAYSLIVHTLVDKGLRPGVDASRADADLSAARMNLIEAETAAQIAIVDLAETMGVAGNSLRVESGPWIKRPTQELPLKSVPENHPLVLLKAAAAATAHSQVISVQKMYRPRLWFHSGIWARGSGSRINANPVAYGLLPQNANYVAGLGIDFPILSYYEIRAKERMARQTEADERANYDLAVQQITKKDARAAVLLDNAHRLADETPKLVAAAKDNELKASERYRVGLANVLEVAEAQRILQNALVQDAVAQTRIWRALLSLSYAHGDLRPFLDLVGKAEAKGN